MKRIYDAQESKLLAQSAQLQTVIDYIDVNNIWTTSTEQKYNEIKAKLAKLNSFATSKQYSESQFKSFAQPNTSNFIVEYLQPSLDLDAQSNQKLSELKNSIDLDLKNILSENTGKMSTLINFIDSAKQEQKSIFEVTNLLQTRAAIAEIRSTYESLKAYASENLESTTADQLQSKLLAIFTLIKKVDVFVETFKREAGELIQQRANIDEIANYVLKDSHHSSRTAIDNLYNTYKQALQSAIDSLTPEQIDNFKQSGYINLASNQTQNNVLTKLNEFYNALAMDNIQAEFVKLVNSEQARVSQGNTLEQFAKQLKEVTSSLAADTNVLDVTDNDRILEYFEQFANTKIDNTAILNPVYVRTYIVKESATNDWYNVVSQNEREKTISLKVKYEYKPVNLNVFENFKGFNTEKQVQITFATASKLGLEPKSRNIIYVDKNTMGYAAKQVIANASELGWQVGEASQAKEKALDKFKKSLGLNENVKSIIIDYANNKTYTLASDNTLAEKTTPNSFKFKFSFPEYHVYHQSASITSDNSKQFVRLSVEGEQIVAEVVVPAFMSIGRDNYSHHTNVLNIVNGNPIEEDTMPSAMINTIKFAFDFDANTKDINLFVTRLESHHVTKHKQLTDANVQDVKTYADGNLTAHVWSNVDFAKWLIINNETWASKDGVNNGDSPLRKDAKNQFTGYQVDTKYFIKNPRTSETYIKTANPSGENIKTQTILSGTILASLFNTGIELFEYSDVKES
ncbi:hypothetical protein [Mycoplasma simbae]|uniref:hypothetical protein n=1 Tax=Mycoplasma simbae TaxID=36744 RepID=UPI000496820E|nr:hypothetical protein [Mycoplasma simbae]